MTITTVIPKAKLTSCERWKLNSFDMPKTEIPADHAQSDDSACNATTPVDTKEIESIIQTAKEDGLKQGYDEGYKNGIEEGSNKGYLEGKQQGESEIKAELSQVNSVFSNLNQQIRSIEQHVAQDMLTLAISLAKKMITEALKIHPELILPVVQEAASQLSGSEHGVQIFLHPDDAEIIRRYQNEQSVQAHWIIHEDTQQERGGCRLEAGGSQIDAGMGTRWHRVLAAIGQNNDWIDN
ncbi:flagellar assembly protein FliH [Nitrosomonas marina]|uniref:Flagellar assembly protein FliH n=1 Tax=Nitrosomonas marina TaxID=917 RepID=A0A1H8FHW3_9PROT|nr:flagellar assembly protein FliH [Nitrosomonas marina]SEN31333.1 flagellar assembly protein FliH [Nitrosomonas marina]